MSDSTINWLYNPVFPTEWMPFPLYELAKWTNGLAFKDVHFSNAGKPVIKIAEIKNGITEQTGLTEQTFSPEIFVSGGDMLFSWSGSPETSIDTVWWRGCEGWLNQHIFKVEPCGQVDRVFFYYILKYLKPQFIQIAKNKQTTGLGHVTVKDLKAITVAFPPLPQQRAIARVLGSLDDKIECNRRMNATLEELAQTHFRALMATARTEDGELRDGWRELSLDAIAKFLNGLALQKFPPKGEALNVIKIAELRRGITEGTDKADAKLPPAYIVEDGDFLFSWSGSLEAVLWTHGRGALNQHLFKVTSEEYPQWFIYQWVHHHLPTFRGIAADKATTMGHIQRRHLTEALCLIPPDEDMKRLEKAIAPVHQKWIANELQNRTLAEVRDFLLPRLLSGEITVQDALTEAD